MKKIFYLLFAVMLCGTFMGCSKDDDKKGDEALGLVGTWRQTFSSGYILMYFDETGYGWSHEYDDDDGGWYDKEWFTYVYKPSTESVIIEWRDYDDIESMNIISLTESKLVWCYSDYEDDIETWVRISNEEVKGGK